MFRTTAPPPSELPSPRALLRSTAVAALIAALVLVVAILPAEYGVDPTGAGRLLGLTQMGEVKAELARDAARTAAAEAGGAAEAAALLAAPPRPADRADTTRVVLEPGEGREVKLVMRADATVDYSWSTDRGVVGYDLHGDPVGDGPAGGGGAAQSYKADAGAWSDQGVLTAAFDGRHGWYWINAGDAPLTVTLRTEGAYLGRLD